MPYSIDIITTTTTPKPHIFPPHPLKKHWRRVEVHGGLQLRDVPLILLIVVRLSYGMGCNGWGDFGWGCIMPKKIWNRTCIKIILKLLANPISRIHKGILPTMFMVFFLQFKQVQTKSWPIIMGLESLDTIPLMLKHFGATRGYAHYIKPQLRMVSRWF